MYIAMNRFKIVLGKEKEFEDLKNEVGDIKNMLNKIIEKLDGSNTN